MIVATEGVRERFVTGRSAENPDRDHSAKSRQPERETGRATPRGFRSPSETHLYGFLRVVDLLLREHLPDLVGRNGVF